MFVKHLFFLADLEAGRTAETCACSSECAIMLALAFGSEYIPETQGFVSCSGAHHSALWTDCHLQHSGSVSTQLFHLCHGWVLPQAQLVLSITVTNKRGESGIKKQLVK